MHVCSLLETIPEIEAVSFFRFFLARGATGHAGVTRGGGNECRGRGSLSALALGILGPQAAPTLACPVAAPLFCPDARADAGAGATASATAIAEAETGVPMGARAGEGAAGTDARAGASVGVGAGAGTGAGAGSAPAATSWSTIA